MSVSSVQRMEDRSGHDALWQRLDLSRACWLTLPRVLMHSMPDDWQGRMAQLLREFDEAFPNRPGLCTRVAVTDHGGQRIPFPAWLIDYRHPDRAAIDAMRSEANTGENP